MFYDCVLFFNVHVLPSGVINDDGDDDDSHLPCFVMVALCNRETIYIFIVFLLLSFFFLA